MKMKTLVKTISNINLCLIFLLPVTTIQAQQRLEMQGTAIIGNKELPKVLYIVPWKSAEPVALNTPPFNSVLNEAFQTIERSTFKRQINYYNSIYPVAENKQ